MHQQALALLRSTSQVDSTGKIENGKWRKKQGGERKTLKGCKSELPSGFVSLLNWRVMMPANTIKYVSLNVGRKRKYVPPNVGRKNVSMNASWSETVTGVQRDFAEGSWSLQIMRFQESSRRVDVKIVHSNLCKRICWPMYQRCASFFWCAGRF